MSITRNHNEVSFECDACNDTLATGLTDFTEAYAYAKREGWRAIKINGEWEHRCSDCEDEE